MKSPLLFIILLIIFLPFFFCNLDKINKAFRLKGVKELWMKRTENHKEQTK